jgi:hypothetical protein
MQNISKEFYVLSELFQVVNLNIKINLLLAVCEPDTSLTRRYCNWVYLQIYVNMKALNFYYCQNVYNTNSTSMEHRRHLAKPLESSSAKPRFTYAFHLTLQEHVLYKHEHSSIHDASSFILQQNT